MNPELPPPIDRFFQTHNTGHTEDFNALFTADAVVSDEEHEYRGAAIKEWIDNAVEQYKPHAEVIALAPAGDKTIVTAQVSGTFPGSPVQLRYQFTVEGDKIGALSIGV